MNKEILNIVNVKQPSSPYNHDTIITDRLQKQKKIAILSDLHCRRFGKGQSRIVDVIQEERPDLIVIPGDLFDVDRDFEISFELITKLKDYPIYFTSGNHDELYFTLSSRY